MRSGCGKTGLFSSPTSEVKKERTSSWPGFAVKSSLREPGTHGPPGTRLRARFAWDERPARTIVPGTDAPEQATLRRRDARGECGESDGRAARGRPCFCAGAG